MKQFRICSLKEFRWMLQNHSISKETSYALISSSYPLDIPELSPMGYAFECYDDIDYDCLGRCFTPEAARRFAKAIKANSHIDNWYFVCDGGRRRSAAVAASALRFWAQESDELEVWSTPSKEPNVWVFVLMIDALGCPMDDFDLDLRIHTNRTTIRQAYRKASGKV